MSTQKETVEEVKTGVEQAANAGTPKKRRRGISNDTRSTSRLKFSHKDVRVNGVFLGSFESLYEMGYILVKRLKVLLLSLVKLFLS